MSRNRCDAGVVAFDGRICVLGGNDGSTIFDSVERFDPQTCEWSPMQEMLTKRYFSV